MCWTVTVISLAAFGSQEADHKWTGFIIFIQRMQFPTSLFDDIYFYVSAVPVSVAWLTIPPTFTGNGAMGGLQWVKQNWAKLSSAVKDEA